MSEVTTDETTEEVIEDITEEVESPEESFDMEAAMSNKRVIPTVDEESEEDETEETEEEDETEEVEIEENVEEELFTLKINGQDQDFTLEQMKLLARKSGAAEERFQEAADGRRQLEDAFKALRTNPFEFMEKMGLDPKQLTEEYLTGIYELDSMSTEQKEAYNDKQELDKLRKQGEMTRAEQEQALRNTQADKHREQYDIEFTKALETADVPKTPETVSKMARYVKQGIDTGIEITVSDAATLVAEDLFNEEQNIVGKMTPEQIKKKFGADFIKKLKNYDLNKIKDPEQGNKVTKATKTSKKGKRRAPKPKSLRDMFSSIENTL